MTTCLAILTNAFHHKYPKPLRFRVLVLAPRQRMKEHSTKVQRTAHYATYGEISNSTKYFILACHGYGQLAKHFIKKFDILASEEVFVLAPEGLSLVFIGKDLQVMW